MSGLFFIYGYDGTGKTFLWNSLSASIRAKGQIVLNVVSSSIVALLLPNGQTAHSRFKVSLSVNQYLICTIKQGSPLARLISSAKLIIWDEAFMLSKFCYEALDKCLRDVLHFNHGFKPDALFGGKVIFLGSDSCQPVIPHGSREDVIDACVNSSYLWHSCHVLQLRENMRQFTLNNKSHALQDLVLFVYPDILLNVSNVDYFKYRNILVSTLNVVMEVNNYIMSLLPLNEKIYLSSDSIFNENSIMEYELYTMSTEILNALNCFSIPQHKLVFMIGVSIMLFRNIDQLIGFCNGTRLQVKGLGDYVIECVILTCRSIGHVVFIPIMNMVPNNKTLPIRFTRRQFPVVLCFAMMINKLQGQTLSTVSVYLFRPMFMHSQLRVSTCRFGLSLW
ncbi:uncharacterized protein LOC130980525 [Arachis stenosperma]|uniref:uncharacterized protein LOC130980525 n=1 Tax=Arachis stenosperma TaxID=217475 RepID=UPI0025ACA877|nr:uncharacterized protein LOC130980525 [Arachis stenosperma]